PPRRERYQGRPPRPGRQGQVRRRGRRVNPGPRPRRGSPRGLAPPFPLTLSMALRFLFLAFALGALGLVPPAPAALAAGTQYWSLRTAADYSQAELDGAALGADGALTVGPSMTALELPGSPVVWSLLVEEGRVFAGTGPGGLVLEIRGSAVHADSSGEGQALSLARGPDGA